MRRRTIDDWRRDVFASQSPDMTAATKVLCLYLADFASMPDLYISVPRGDIADALGVHKARVAERLKRACDAGFLHSVSKGHLHHTAVYRATFPDVVVTRPCVQQSGTHMDTAPSDATGSAERYPSNPGSERETEINAYRSAGRHNYSGPVPTTDDRNVGIDDEALDPEARFRLAVPAELVCEFHPWQRCPRDCRNHPDNRDDRRPDSGEATA